LTWQNPSSLQGLGVNRSVLQRIKSHSVWTRDFSYPVVTAVYLSTSTVQIYIHRRKQNAVKKKTYTRHTQISPSLIQQHFHFLLILPSINGFLTRYHLSLFFFISLLNFTFTQPFLAQFQLNSCSCLFVKIL